MKVLFLIGRVGLGGHARSALAIGRALKAQGIEVHFAAGEGRGISLIKESGFSYSILPTGFRKGYVADRRTFRAAARVAKVFAPDVIHAFDYNGLMLGAGPARRGPGKFVFTICGGPVPRARVPFMRPLVVFSPELRVGLQKQGYPEENILVNAGRIEPAQNVHPKAWLDEFRREIGISEMEPVILMISRIVHGKLSALLHFVKTADCAAEFRQMSFLIVGAADDPHSLEQLREAISRVNAKHGRSVIWWTDRESGHASRLLPMASVVVGMGRTAYEAMSLGIPTMVMGAYGFSAVACEETCNMLMEKNFSGRDALDRPREDSSPEKAASVMFGLLQDSAAAEKVGLEGQRWINSHLSAEKGAEFYARLYAKDKEFFRLPSQVGIFHLYLRALNFRTRSWIYKWLPPFALRKLASMRQKRDFCPGLET
jgi:hypothetical protein